MHLNCLLTPQILLLLNARYEGTFQLMARVGQKVRYSTVTGKLRSFYGTIISKQMTLTYTTPRICIISAEPPKCQNVLEALYSHFPNSKLRSIGVYFEMVLLLRSVK